MPFEFISTNAAAVSNMGKFGRRIRANRFYTHYKWKPGKLADFMTPTVAITLVTLDISWPNITWYWKQFDGGQAGICWDHELNTDTPYIALTVSYGAPFSVIRRHRTTTYERFVLLCAEYNDHRWFTIPLSVMWALYWSLLTSEFHYLYRSPP